MLCHKLGRVVMAVLPIALWILSSTAALGHLLVITSAMCLVYAAGPLNHACINNSTTVLFAS
jgi:hypothetical protein